MTDQRPAYTTSKRAMWICGGLAWAAIFAIIAGALAGKREAVEISGTIVPAMVMMIVSLLGLHRAFGSIDMHTTTRFGGQAPRRRRRDAQPEPEEQAQ